MGGDDILMVLGFGLGRGGEVGDVGVWGGGGVRWCFDGLGVERGRSRRVEAGREWWGPPTSAADFRAVGWLLFRADHPSSEAADCRAAGAGPRGFG